MERRDDQFTDYELKNDDAQYQAGIQDGQYNTVSFEGSNFQEQSFQPADNNLTNAQYAEVADKKRLSQPQIPTVSTPKNPVVGFLSEAGHSITSEIHYLGKTFSKQYSGKSKKQITKEIASDAGDAVIEIWRDAKKELSNLKNFFRRSSKTDNNTISLDGQNQKQDAQNPIDMGGSMNSASRPNPFQLAKQKAGLSEYK